MNDNNQETFQGTVKWIAIAVIGVVFSVASCTAYGSKQKTIRSEKGKICIQCERYYVTKKGDHK